MYRIFIDPNWSFKECVFKSRALKSQYQEVLMSFSFLKNPKAEADFIVEIRNQIYALQFEEWKKDKIWEYLNNDVGRGIFRYIK